MSEDLKSVEFIKQPLQTVFINGNKISTLIPNRIFVGGFPQNTSEDELKNFFYKYGEIRDVKIIPDKAGQAKGSYGFVTFESQEVAERIITEQAESLVFRDRKLNIGRAVKKQPLTGKSELQNTLILNALPLQYGAVYPYPDYSYILNPQDLSSLYQNYANQISPMSIFPTYASSLLAPFLTGGNEALGLSINPYQQLQSLIPLSMSGLPSQSSSPFTNDSSSYLADQLNNNSTLSVDSSIPTDGNKSSDSTSKTSEFEFQFSKLHGKIPFSAITNQVLNNLSNDEKSEYELPKKKIKHEEVNTVTKFGEPIHYLLPK